MGYPGYLILKNGTPGLEAITALGWETLESQ